MIYLNQKSLQNIVARFVLAFLPHFSTIPIQDITLLDYAVTLKSVNSASLGESNVSFGLTANGDDAYIIDTRREPSRSHDLYKSGEQKRGDQYEIDEDNWHKVAFKEVYSTSTCRLELHIDWMKNHGYTVDGIVEMNLLEQGISSPFKITSIRHIQPQKIPGDEDPDDDYEYRPVTGLFTHQSNDVYTLGFTNAPSLGVTATHPIYSTTYHDWRLAGELEVGERVLTFKGEATVSSTEKRAGIETVYNLEVKDLHNFLVGDEGVVVHNGCTFAELLTFFKNVVKLKGSNIPKRIHLETSAGEIFIPESGFKHIFDVIFNQGHDAYKDKFVFKISPAAAENRFAIEMSDMLPNINKVIQDVITNNKYNEKIFVGKWEFMFSPGDNNGSLIKLYHAVFR